MSRIAFAAALISTTCTAGVAQADTLAALVGDNSIVLIDSDTGKASKTMSISDASGRVIGIDVRPADGMLYAITADGVAWTVNATSGAASQKSKFDMPLPKADAFVVDFNPVADRLRLMGSDGTNLRINVDDGKVTKDGQLKFADSDMHKGEKPNIVAGSYTNSMKGAKETTLFNIDMTIGGLIKQAPPNDGVLNAVGKLGVMPKSAAFDIPPSGMVGWLVADGAVHKVDLMSGKATKVSDLSGVTGAVRDIAVMPK
jgi:hypothetical protein